MLFIETVNMSWFAYKTIMILCKKNKKTNWVNNSTNHGFQNM